MRSSKRWKPREGRQQDKSCAHFSKVKVDERIFFDAVSLHADNSHAFGPQPVRPLAQRVVGCGEALQRGQEFARRELPQLRVFQMQRRH